MNTSVNLEVLGSHTEIMADPEDLDPIWIEVWERLDVYSDGRILLKDMEDLILHTEYSDSLPQESITKLLLKADANKDGFISQSEFLYMIRIAKKSPKMQQIFRELAFLAIPRSARDAQVRQYIDEYSCRPPPIFMVTVSVAEISVFIYYVCTMTEPLTAYGPCPFESPLIYNPYRRYEAWRFISYALIHSGYLHILTNLLMQLLLGIILELVHKWWRVMIVYLSGVLGGCLAASVATPTYYLAGASGGVYALEYAYLGNLILNWSEMKFPLVQLLVLLAISIMDVAFAVWDTYFNENSSNTSYVAHIGGALTGLLVGVNILRNLKKEPWERIFWWIALILLVGLFGAAIIVHIAASDYFPESDYST